MAAAKIVDECETKHAPLAKGIEYLEKDVARVEESMGKTSEEMWAAINDLRKSAANLEKSVASMNAKLIIFVGLGGFAAQTLAKYVLK